MIKYQDNLTKVKVSTSNGVSLRKDKIWLRLRLVDDSEGLILNLYNVYYFPNSLCNLISLRLLNNSNIYYNNKYKSLYLINLRKILTQVKYWKNSFLFNLLNFFNSIMYLLRINVDIYQPCHTLWMNILLLPLLLFI